MITFQKQPIGTLDVRSGQLSGLPTVKPAPKPADIGMDTKEFHSQVIQLAQSKVPLQKALKAVDMHPDITNKPIAKSMAEGVYEIMGAGEKPKTMAK